MPKSRLCLCVLVLVAGLLAGSCARPPSSEVAVSAASEMIRPEALRAHTEFLADDALGGRGTGSRGHDLAMKYLQAQFAALGLRGGAGDGGYFQKVPILRGEVQTAVTSLVIRGKTESHNLVYGTDFLLVDTEASEDIEFSGPVIFAGFGVSAGANVASNRHKYNVKTIAQLLAQTTATDCLRRLHFIGIGTIR